MAGVNLLQVCGHLPSAAGQALGMILRRFGPVLFYVPGFVTS